MRPQYAYVEYPTLYPLHDWYSKEGNRLLRARLTGEYRHPKKGEWYISGAIIEAYRAPNDLTTSYFIAEVVEVEVIEIVKAVLEN